MSYDFLKERYHTGKRLLSSLLPAIDERLMKENLFHLLNFDLHPSPVPPAQAMHYEAQDRAMYEKAVSKVERLRADNAEFEMHHGRRFRELRTTREQQRHWNHRMEDEFQYLYDLRPKEAKWKEPKYLSTTTHTKALEKYPELVKKETEEAHKFKTTLFEYLSPSLQQEFEQNIWLNRLNNDSIRQKAVAIYHHLSDERSKIDTHVQKEIEADFLKVGGHAISTFEEATDACQQAAKLQQELSYINVTLMKDDDFMIKCVTNKFDTTDINSPLQQFMVRHSLGPNCILSSKRQKMETFSDRSLRLQNAATTPAVAEVSMTWAAFRENLDEMARLLTRQQDTSIFSAQRVAMSASTDYRRQNERSVRISDNHSYKAQKDTERSASRERQRNAPAHNPNGPQRARSTSRDRQRKHADSTLYRDPYPNWEKQTESPKSAAASSTSNKRKFEFKHKVNAAVVINSGRQLQCPVYIDVYGNAYTTSDDTTKTASVTYLDVRDEDFDTN